MGFASAWLQNHALFPALIGEEPDNQTGIIVVVPAFSESGISQLLNSLKNCTEPACPVELLIVVNAPSDASELELENNMRCIEAINDHISSSKAGFLKIFCFDTGPQEFKDWGVGCARKTGMDEALRRFSHTGNREGVIVCLDADCTVAENYLVAICNELYKSSKHKACSISFEHQETGDPGSLKIINYELHLRCHVSGLRYAGYPWATHTVGSAMAVKAEKYMSVGGMNRRRAGEDFYFIQKIADSETFFNLTSTTVYPSARSSLRVPFGTGATIEKLLSAGINDPGTYDPAAYQCLRDLFGYLPALFELTPGGAESIWVKLHPALKQFVSKAEYTEKLAELKTNTAGYVAYRKRFFSWFNMFRIIKFLNHSHESVFTRKPANAAAAELLKYMGIDTGELDPRALLALYRELDRKFTYFSC
jgi:glycosyltransferase involved in cell wall biosynthesis